MRKALKAATRKVLSIADLKLARLSGFQAITRELETTRRELETTRRELETTRRELETTRRELETTRRLLTPAILSYSNQNLKNSTPKTPPITQIFISEGDVPLGRLLQGCTESIRRSFPASDHKIYGNQEIEEFINKHYGRDLLVDYRKLKPYAYKADLARLCIVNIMGGWYADISITWTTPFTIPGNTRLLAARDILQNCRSSWGASNGIFYAEKNHPALIHGIEMIQRNIRNSYYGLTPLCPTGPNIWGKAIAANAEPSETLFWDLLALTPNAPNKNLYFADQSGNIYAFFKPSSGGDGLSAFNSNSNNYGECWHRRDIYTQTQ